MSILQYKYKAHKLVNTLFYIIVFAIGFVLGFGAKKIDFNKILSQLLMIDHVSAYTIYEDEEKIINENYILDRFSNYNSNFDIKNTPYVFCYKYDDITRLSCVAFNEEIYNNLTYINSFNNSYTFNLPLYNYILGTDYFKFSYSYITEEYFDGSFDTIYFHKNLNFNPIAFTNFNVEIDGEIKNDWNLLDFEGSNLKFNKDLFKDNPDFKEVCVNNYDTFSITSNQIQDYDDNNNPMYHSFDFMWFPNGMKGISTYRYDTTEDTHVYLYEKSETTFSGWWYWLNTKDEIDLYFDRDNPGMYLEAKGYKNKYDYYNYTMYPFEMAFTTEYHYYPIFWFKDPYIEYLDGTKKDDSEKYCFYIKNEYDINILNHNSMGDVYGDITILGGLISSDSTSKNEADLDNSSLPNTLYSLLTRLRNSINFVVYHIEGLFYSLPVIFQMFIISILLIFALKIIINMIVK